MPTQATMKGVPLALFGTTATTGTSSAVAFPINDDNPTVEVVGQGTIGAGTLILEENGSDPAYAGTWSQITSIACTTLTGGASQVFHILGSVKFFRARFSANVTGGGGVSVNVWGE